LCEAGDVDAAYRLLLQTEYPSWLHMVNMGATTLWERWDGIFPDGQIHSAQMNSLNQYTLGTVIDWLHRTVAGLEPAAPGYRKIRFRPRPGGELTHASARHRTPYGMAAVSWHLDADRFEMDVEVPANTEAEVILPGPVTQPVHVTSGRHHWSVALNS
jgi:alpha-L-rhamnosidase